MPEPMLYGSAKSGVVVEVLERRQLSSTVIFKGEDDTKTVDNKRLFPIPVPKVPRYLSEMPVTDATYKLITYLRLPGIFLRMYLKARDSVTAVKLEANYFSITGENLVEGTGYSIQNTNKQGNEASVFFMLRDDMPVEFNDILSPDGTGHVNRIDFFWLCVRAGFRVNR